jgi:3-oxoacyl-[acyl-carrier-protein] synthase II
MGRFIQMAMGAADFAMEQAKHNTTPENTERVGVYVQIELGAFEVIEQGYADAMICGGSEAAVTPLSVAGFSNMKALSIHNESPKTASGPWDIDHDRFVFGEDAGILIFEERDHARRRGATILAEIVGYAANTDAIYTNSPPEDGRGVDAL